MGINGIEESKGCLQPKIMTEPHLSLDIKVKVYVVAKTVRCLYITREYILYLLFNG